MNKKKIVAVVAVVVALVLLGAAIALAYIKGQEEEPLGENQRYVYAYITGIEGNEVTYTELDESVVAAYLEQQAEAEESDDASDGDSGADADEDAPSGGGMPEGMEMPSGMPDSDTSGESGNSGRGSMGSGETVTTLIPVGVTVHTTSDAKTTFQRLVAGDIIKILMETNADGEEVIIEIWML